MLTEQVVKEMQKAVAIEQLNNLEPMEFLTTPCVFVPEGFDTVNLEKYMPARTRRRGTYSTTLIDAFSDYVNSMAYEGKKIAQCFVNEQVFSAVALLDFGTDESEFEQGHCDFKACLQLEKTAEYRALLNTVNVRHSQRELAEFIEDYSSHIAAEDAEGNEIKLSKAVATIRNMKLKAKRDSEHSVQQFNESRSLMESIDAESDGLPAKLIFNCEPYHGLGLFQAVLRLNVISGESVEFTMRIIRSEEFEERMAIKFFELINNGINDSICDVRIGEFKP